jgi:ADP-dependent NAD(P)H-hydrate dehydratase / NAD(P)H-hydrate epimerase
MRVCTAAQMRECDRLTIEEVGLAGIALMETAGQAAARAVLALLAPLEHPTAGIFCGRGNNGGDGFVVARVLMQHGYDVDVYLIGPRAGSGGDAGANLSVLEVLVEEGLTVGRCRIHALGDQMEEGISIAGLLHGVARHEVVVDALLGTGLGGPARTPYREVIEHLNRPGSTILSIDIPSGLDSDTGRALGAAVRADHTVTFGLAKRGQILYPGREHCGELAVIDIGIPDGICDRAGVDGVALTREVAMRALPQRPVVGHKGTFGHVLALGGAQGKTGAITLTSMAALRAGAGLCTAAGTSSDIASVALVHPEVMTQVLGTAAALSQAAAGKVVAAGPGLGGSPAARELVMRLCDLDTVRVLDADALNIVAREVDAGGLLRRAAECGPVVLTPHPGEFGRLTGRQTAALVADPVSAARDFATDTGCIVVLKGAATVVAHPDGRYALNTSGNPGMATAGSGDVLTGVIAGLCAQTGVDAWDATCCGVFIHGLAGDLAAQSRGRRSLTASDLLDHLGAALEACEC